MDGTAAPPDAVFSHSVTLITDMKITWGVGNRKSLAYLGRETTMNGNKNLVTNVHSILVSRKHTNSDLIALKKLSSGNKQQ